MTDEVHFSTNVKNDWGTPLWLFDELNEEFGFRLDLFASRSNTLCENYLENCFFEDWKEKAGGKPTFGNPPYGTEYPTTWDFVQLAFGWYKLKKVESVLLVPARTDTEGWHKYCMKGQIRLIRGRLKFRGCKKAWPAPFPSAVIVFAEDYSGMGKTINARGK